MTAVCVKSAIRQQVCSLEKAQRRIEQLEHSVDLLLRRKYGPRSERIRPSQSRLFIEEDDEPVSKEADVPLETPEMQKRRGRQTLAEHLPRVQVVIELSEHERSCPGRGELRARFDE